MPQLDTISARRATLTVLLMGVVFLLPAVAQAAPPPPTPVAIYMNYRLVSGQGAANAVAVFDSSLLAPGTVVTNLTDLTSFDITLTGLSTSPPSTTFTKADLTGWILAVGPSGNIYELNFFMDPPNVNGDGYAINGTQELELSLYDGDESTGTRIAVFQGRAAQQELSIPTLSDVGVGVLVLLIAGAAAVALRRRRALA